MTPTLERLAELVRQAESKARAQRLGGDVRQAGEALRAAETRASEAQRRLREDRPIRLRELKQAIDEDKLLREMTIKLAQCKNYLESDDEAGRLVQSARAEIEVKRVEAQKDLDAIVTRGRRVAEGPPGRPREVHRASQGTRPAPPPARRRLQRHRPAGLRRRQALPLQPDPRTLQGNRGRRHPLRGPGGPRAEGAAHDLDRPAPPAPGDELRRGGRGDDGPGDDLPEAGGPLEAVHARLYRRVPGRLRRRLGPVHPRCPGAIPPGRRGRRSATAS